MPLAERMVAHIPEALQPWYADDASATGRAIHNARCLQFLAEHGPAYGYWANPSKSIYICKGEDERIARAAFTALGLTVKYRRGARYLGSFLGCRTLLEDYVRDKITTWSSAASTLAKLAVKYPQSVYTGYTMCLQSEWQYLCRCTPNIAYLFEPFERVLRDELLPAFIGVSKSDITGEFRDLLAIAVKRGGMGIRNPLATAEEFYDTSCHTVKYLVESMVDETIGTFDLKAHTAQVGKAMASARTTRAMLESDLVERHTRGKPAAKRRIKKQINGTGSFLTAIPHFLNGTILSANQWRDNIRLLFNLEPLDMPQHCDGCGAKMTVDHALSCKVGGLVHIRHNDLNNEWCWLGSCALSHSCVEREPSIFSSVGRRVRAIAAEQAQTTQTTPQSNQPQQQQQTQQPQQQPGQQRQQQQQQQQNNSQPVDETRGDAGVHGFWKHGRQAVFDIRVTDTEARSYRHKDPVKVLADHEQEKKRKYLRPCLELRKDFTPMVYSVDGMAGREAKAAERRMAAYLAEKWHRPYSQMVHFVRLRMRMSIARSNSLLIRGSRDRMPSRPFIQSGSALNGGQTWTERW